MRRSAIIVAVMAIGAIAALCAQKKTPPHSVPEIIERAFDYRLVGPADVVERTYDFPFSFHGVWYWENARVRLSSADYTEIVSRMKAGSRFKKRDVSGRIVYDRDLGKRRIS